jgi:hypothetical protein
LVTRAWKNLSSKVAIKLKTSPYRDQLNATVKSGKLGRLKWRDNTRHEER